MGERMSGGTWRSGAKYKRSPPFPEGQASNALYGESIICIRLVILNLCEIPFRHTTNRSPLPTIPTRNLTCCVSNGTLVEVHTCEKTSLCARTTTTPSSLATTPSLYGERQCGASSSSGPGYLAQYLYLGLTPFLSIFFRSDRQQQQSRWLVLSKSTVYTTKEAVFVTDTLNAAPVWYAPRPGCCWYAAPRVLASGSVPVCVMRRDDPTPEKQLKRL